MPWVKVDDHFDEHPKLARVGPLGWGVWLAGLAYCNRNLTDGFIPWAKARSLCSFDAVDDDGTLWRLGRTSGMSGDDIESEWVIGLLIEAGLWDEVDNGRGRVDGYRIHDYDQYQPSKADVLAEREANARRQSAFRDRKRERNAKSNGVTNGSVTDMSQPPRTRTRTKKETSEDVSPPHPPKGEPAAPAVEGAKPFDLFLAVCEEMGRDPADFEGRAKDQQLAAAKVLVGSGIGTDDARRLYRWLAPQAWVVKGGGVDLKLMAGQAGKWTMNGRPDSPPMAPAPGSETMVRSSNGTVVVPTTPDDKDAIRERARRRLAALDAGQPAPSASDR